MRFCFRPFRRREAARRIQCTNNIKQLALAAANYESANGSFPIAHIYNWCFKTGGAICNDGEYWGAIPRLLVFAEQQPLYNAINWTDIPYGCRNSTVAGAGITMLWCPSDGTIAGLRFYEACAGWDGTTVPLTYTDYATMGGTYIPNNGKLRRPWRYRTLRTVCTPRSGRQRMSTPVRPARVARLRSRPSPTARATRLPSLRWPTASSRQIGCTHRGMLRLGGKRLVGR